MAMRIEDLDPDRSKQAYIDAIFRDYELLGLEWEGEAVYQSKRREAYEDAFRRIRAGHRVYECFCTRADIHAASAPHRGEKAVYPGTCRALTAEQRRLRIEGGRRPAWRLEVPPVRIGLVDGLQGAYGQWLDRDCGDFIIKRNDGAFAYQLAVVVDDAAQGVTSVVRGVDLLPSTPQQIFLQRCLGLVTPAYAHVPLLVAKRDRRLSKRDRDAGMEELLGRYKTAEGILGHIAYRAGLISDDAPTSAEELVSCARLDALAGKIQIPWNGAAHERD